MLIEFHGRRVIVAGAARGLGRAIAEGFAAGGAQVWACDLLVDEVKAYSEAAVAGADSIRAAHVDVTDSVSISAVVAEVTMGGAAIDVLVYVLRAGCADDVPTINPAQVDERVDENPQRSLIRG